MSNKVVKNNLYNKFVGLLNKKGLKIKAKYILDRALLLTSKKLPVSTNSILLAIFLKLHTFIEVKSVKIKRRVVFVPFYISYKRRIYLVIKWILLATRRDTRKIPLFQKLSFEFIKLLAKKNLKSYTLELRKQNTELALKNRSNTHYRW
jgi:ribosomal protein S7